MSTNELGTLKQELAYCTGTHNHYQHSFMRWFKYTDGIQTLAAMAGAYWLIDLAASHQIKPRVRREPFQLWSLRKLPEDAKNAAVAECRRDSGQKPIVKQLIPFTDFPFDELGNTFEWYVCDGVMLLKSEY